MMQTPFRIPGAIALAVIALLWATRAAAAPPERVLLAPTEMRREIGVAWFVTLPPGWETGADDVDHPQRSTAVLLENGRALGPAHAIHATIRERGDGAYSHWLGQLYFSTSDGSDPRTNGREYVLERGQPPGDGPGSGARTIE